MEADLARDDWFDPTAGKVKLGPCGRAWLAERPLAKTTQERYEVAFRRYIDPSFGNVPVNEIREADVRWWYAGMLQDGTGRASAAKAYCVLRATLNSALDDGAIKRNPCRIPGAGEDKSDERPVLSFDEVLGVVEALPPRFRMMACLATFTSLRFGELAALTRRAAHRQPVRGGRGRDAARADGAHGSLQPRAAMIYLHVLKGRSRHIADKLSTQLRAARATDNESAGD